MKMTRRSILLAITFVVATASFSLAAPKTSKASKYLTVSGKVLEINRKERTLLVSDTRTNKLYRVIVPENATFKITFGKNMRQTYSTFDDVDRKNRVSMRCTRHGDDRLARLEDGREVIVVDAANF